MRVFAIKWVLLLRGAAIYVVAPYFNGEGGMAGREGDGGRSLSITRVGTHCEVETSLCRTLRERIHIFDQRRWRRLNGFRLWNGGLAVDLSCGWMLVAEHGENRDAWGRKRHVDSAGCFMEKAQSTRPTGKLRRLREGHDKRELLERIEVARTRTGKARHVGQVMWGR